MIDSTVDEKHCLREILHELDRDLGILRNEFNQLQSQNLIIMHERNRLLNKIEKAKRILVAGRTVGNNMMIAYTKAEEALR